MKLKVRERLENIDLSWLNGLFKILPDDQSRVIITKTSYAARSLYMKTNRKRFFELSR